VARALQGVPFGSGVFRKDLRGRVIDLDHEWLKGGSSPGCIFTDHVRHRTRGVPVMDHTEREEKVT